MLYLDPSSPSKSRSSRRLGRLTGIVSATIAGLVALVMTPGAAFAGDGPWSTTKSSLCSSAISSKTGGGSGIARLKYDAYRASARKYVIEYGYSKADTFEVCNGDYAVSPYQITISQQFQFNGVSLSCTGGIDASFPRNVGVSVSCTTSGSTVTETLTTTCTAWSSSCKIDQGYLEVLAPSGASFANYVLARTKVVVTGSSGDACPWTTAWI